MRWGISGTGGTSTSVNDCGRIFSSIISLPPFPELDRTATLDTIVTLCRISITLFSDVVRADVDLGPRIKGSIFFEDLNFEVNLRIPPINDLGIF